RRVPMELREGNEPGLLAGTVALHHGLQAIALDIDRRDQHADSDRYLGGITLEPREQGTRRHRVPALFPGLSQHRVDPGLQAERVFLHLEELAGALSPGFPAERRIERRKV